MGADSSYRQRTAQQMSGATLQGAGIRTVVNGQVDADSRNLHISHNPASAGVKLTVIVRRGLLKRCPGVSLLCSAGDDGLVIGFCQLPNPFQFLCVCLLDHFFIGSVDGGLVVLVVEIADDGIQGQQQSQDEDYACDHDFEIPSFHTFCLLKEMSRRFPSGTRIGLSLSLTSGQPSCGW